MVSRRSTHRVMCRVRWTCRCGGAGLAAATCGGRSATSLPFGRAKGLEVAEAMNAAGGRAASVAGWDIGWIGAGNQVGRGAQR